MLALENLSESEIQRLCSVENGTADLCGCSGWEGSVTFLPQKNVCEVYWRSESESDTGQTSRQSRVPEYTPMKSVKQERDLSVLSPLMTAASWSQSPTHKQKHVLKWLFDRKSRQLRNNFVQHFKREWQKDCYEGWDAISCIVNTLTQR